MHLEKLLKEYSKHHGLDTPQSDSSGIYRLLINDSLSVSLESTADHQGFYIYSIICTLNPLHDVESTFKALSGNLFGKETGKSTIAYEPQSRALVLQQFVPHGHMHEHEFSAILADFIKYLVYWINKMDLAVA